MPGAKRHYVQSRAVRTEINDYVPPLDDGAQIVALINLSNHLAFRITRGAGNKRPSHAAFGAGDDDFGHAPRAKRDMQHQARSTSVCGMSSWSLAMFGDSWRSWAPAASDIPLRSGPSWP